MKELADLRPAARRLIVATVLLGAGALAIRIPDLGRWNLGDLLACVGLALAGALAEQFTVEIHHETENENFSLTDAIWVPALLLARPSVLTFAVLVGTVVGQSVRHWTGYKIAYNACQFVLAVTAAEAVYGLFHLPHTLGLETWLAGAAAMLAYFCINETFIATVISLVEGEPLRRVLLLPAGLNVLHAAGNVTIGMLGALVWSTGPVGLPLLVTPIVLTFLAYRGWAHNKQQEQQARERERMHMLYEAGRSLFGPLDVTTDFQPFLQLVRKMVEATGVELVLLEESDIHVYSSESGLTLTASLKDHELTPERLVSTRPGLSTYSAPITGAEIRGTLAVHRKQPLSAAEGSLVDALASQVYVKRENERLFQETLEQRSHLADVVGNTSDGIFAVSSDHLILSWNPAMERITGFRRPDVVGRPCDEVLRLRPDHPDTDPDATRGLDLESADTRDALVIRQDGSERWIRYTSNPMPNRDGGAKAYVLVARDVTAELEAEKLKGDFVATVSHELRTPLTPLKGFLLSLEQGLLEASPESMHEYFAIMRRQVERLERLINDLLDVSRIDAGKVTMEPTLIPLTDFLVEQIRESEHLQHTGRVEFVTPEQTVVVRADPFRVGQVVTNLLSNAFKYSPPATPVEVWLTVAGPKAIVSVHNMGEGISIADQGRVFERFYRAEGGLTRKSGGVGLGLYIARRLVEAMGGHLTLESEPGRGCTFAFSLPIAQATVEYDPDARRPMAFSEHA